MSTASSADKSPSFEKTWGSSTSSGYCSDEAADSDAEFEQYFTARTSFFPKGRKANSDVKKEMPFGLRKQEKAYFMLTKLPVL